MTKTFPKIGPHSQRTAFAKLDGRGRVARRMRAIREELTEALGGPDVISPQQRIIIDMASIRVVRTDMLMSKILNGDDTGFENERRLNWHLASLRRDLAALGLDRRPDVTPGLKDYIANTGPAA